MRKSRALYAARRRALAKSCATSATDVEIAPLLDCAKLLYDGPWVAERTAALAPLLQTNPGAIHPVVRAIVEKGLSISAVEAFEGLYALQAYQRDAEAMWREHRCAGAADGADHLHTSTHVRADPIALNAKLGRYTNFVNLLDMSAIAVPAGFRADGTGFGVTLIGPAWAEAAAVRAWRTRMRRASPCRRRSAARSHAARRRRQARRCRRAFARHAAASSIGEPQCALHSRSTKTAPTYKLYAMQTTPPKPALIHDRERRRARCGNL